MQACSRKEAGGALEWLEGILGQAWVREALLRDMRVIQEKLASWERAPEGTPFHLTLSPPPPASSPVLPVPITTLALPPKFCRTKIHTPVGSMPSRQLSSFCTEHL